MFSLCWPSILIFIFNLQETHDHDMCQITKANAEIKMTFIKVMPFSFEIIKKNNIYLICFLCLIFDRHPFIIIVVFCIILVPRFDFFYIYIGIHISFDYSLHLSEVKTVIFLGDLQNKLLSYRKCNAVLMIEGLILA